MMATWEKVLLVILAVAIVFLFRPGIKQLLEESKKVENPDWMSALFPIGIVVLFIIMLIALS